MSNLEQEMFRRMKPWPITAQIHSPSELMNTTEVHYSLFSFLYQKTQELYLQIPRRKNGQDSFIHPLNVVLNLKLAKVNDPLTICSGLVHDYVEELVDIYKRENKLTETGPNIKLLDEYELKLFSKLAQEIDLFCRENNLPYPQEIIDLVKILTRHKRDFYYQSIANIFNTKNKKIKEKAIQIKLADRLHNILSLECFNEQERIYQCFKNIFILNNVKKYLLKEYGVKVFQPGKDNPTERLFNKCCKATYSAFLDLSSQCGKKVEPEVREMLQLAFKKYALEMSGMWVVTRVDKNEVHPLRLFQGVVRKYDKILFREFDKFKEAVQRDRDYIALFFGDYNLNLQQIDNLIDYKDAYAMKEVVAYLLYKHDYVIGKFLSSDLSAKGRI
ncbi:MAG TPA: hypothetical protein VJC39_05225 [Candidatus Nanoarchaeia archaeon]|nr:hypothetical protein [Candidatus Nanoarchaeia archaeon]